MIQALHYQLHGTRRSPSADVYVQHSSWEATAAVASLSPCVSVRAGTVLYLSLPGALASLWLLACLAYARARGKESGAVQGDLLAIVVIYTVRSAVLRRA